MKTVPLYKISILGRNAEKKQIAEKLQHLGVMHIAKADLSEGKDKFKPDTALPDVEKISMLLLKYNYILEHTKLKKEFVLKGGLPEFAKVFRKAESFAENIVPKIERLVEERKQVQENLALINSQLKTLQQIPVPIVLAKSKQVATLLYSGTEEFDFSKLKTACKSKKVQHEKIFYFLINTDIKNKIKLQQELEKSNLRNINISFMEQNSKITTEKLNHSLAELNKRLEEIKTEVFQKINGKQSDILFNVSVLENYYAQYVIAENFVHTKNFFFAEGYCEKEDLNKIKEQLPGTTIHAELVSTFSKQEDSKEKNQRTNPENKAPTKFNNSKIGKHFQLITEMFGIPTYGALDPTPLVGFFFPFFFGFMLSDVGYGLMLLLMIAFLRFKFGEKMKSAVVIFGLSGISSIIFGLLFGSFFGNLVKITPIIADSFSISFLILQVSLLIGLIHLNIGVALSAYQLISRKKSWKVIITNVAPFPLLQVMGVLFYFKQNMIALAILGIIAAALIIKQKSLFGIMDISGYFGTWFSYARLLALSLATAGVALAINIVAEKTLAWGWVGIILWLIIIIGGHVFNFLLNILGCTIHSARLHYVEFFSLFFEGEGHKFQPFEVKSVLEEE